MTHLYKVEGMTCGNCKKHVEEGLASLSEVKSVEVDLEQGEARIDLAKHLTEEELQQSVGSKYSITQKSDFDTNTTEASAENKTKFQQLKPLFLIFFYIASASVLLHISNFSIEELMLDFMGLFFIVFSFFKFLDYKGFPDSFAMYDPIAKVFKPYAWVYPFIETALGLAFFFRFQLELALVLTILILGVTSIGVTKSLFSKNTIKCACLGTALNLPMTEATFIENAIMLIMATSMLLMI